MAPEVSFGDDPLRMMRAARFIAGYGLEPTAEVRAAVVAMADRLEIVSPERIRDEFDKLLTVDHPSAGLWFLVETGLADQFLPELPAMRLEHDPIHRHKDVLTHTIAVVENVTRPAPDDRDRRPGRGFDFRITRLAALFHDIGKPKTRGYLEGKGTTFHHHDAVGARMTRKRMTALRYSNDDIAQGVRARGVAPAVPHVRDGVVGRRRPPLRARRGGAVGRVERPHPVRLHHPQREEGGSAVAADGRSGSAHRRTRGGRGAGGDPPGTRWQRGDGDPRRRSRGASIGEAMNYLLDVRLDEGLLGDEQIRQRLVDWWQARRPADARRASPCEYPQSVRALAL